jgi:tetratricopeptide (TPR) repeat protein
MSSCRALVLVLLAATSTSALASEQLSYGPPPAWVTPHAIPATANAPAEAPIAVLLSDQQIRFEPGKTTTYAETAIKIQNGQGLAAGNISIPWDPTTDTVTVHKLLIRRGTETIDVLKNGQTFTILRREQNLDAATLDGQLTANIQPEGLQEGDVLVFATSAEHRDPVLKGHVESQFANWNGVPFKAARVRLVWPEDMKLKVQRANLPSSAAVRAGGQTSLEIALDDVQPLIVPKGAPLRFSVGRYGEASDFSSWAEVAELIRPHFRSASIIPSSGALRDEVEKIRKAGNQRSQVEQALALVQNRVRYVALLMGQGGYVPASAESTWSRRFGDCKAKTALLVGILRELGIEAEPVLVNTSIGDVLPDRLPMLGVFDHVLVRAKVGGKTYWLDGTRTGDASLEQIAVPYYRWGLPLDTGGKLVPIVPPPLTVPDTEVSVAIDATNGIYSPAPFRVERTLRGDLAVATYSLLSKLAPAQLDETQKQFWKGVYDYVTVKEAKYAFDKEKSELSLSMNGEAKIEWDDGWFYVPNSNIAYEPDFERTAGIHRDAPYALGYPSFERSHVEIRLPPSFPPTLQNPPAPVHETLAGVEYARTLAMKNHVLTLDRTERTILPEIGYRDALAAAARLKALSDEDVYLRVPGNYRMTDADTKARLSEKPASTQAYIDRGLVYLNDGKYEEAINDFTEAHELDPKNAWSLANRALAYTWKRDFKSAEKDLLDVAAIDPENFVALRARGLIAEFRGDFAGALATYDKIIAKDSDDNWVRLRRISLRMQQGKRDEALRDVNAVIATDPQNVSALGKRAYILADKEDWAAAEKDLAAALTADPANSDALATKAVIAMHRKDYDAAAGFLSKALDGDPDNYVARALQGQLLKRDGGDKAAVKAFDEAVARSPDDTFALLGRALANIEAKDFDAAEKDIARVLELKPSDPLGMQAQGELELARGSYKAAVETFSRGLGVFPGNGRMLSQRAQAYHRLGEYDLALADTDAAVKAGLASPSIRLLRINILAQKGDLSGAGAEIGRLTEENPTSEFAMVAAGKAYSAIGMQQKAMQSFDRAIAINPVPYIYINRSQVRPFTDVEGKLADLDAALKIDPNYEETLAEKARVLSRAGRHAEAIELYDRAIKLALEPRDLQLGKAVALERAGRFAEAKAIFESEDERAKTAGDFNRLCWVKAINDVALQSALEDCRSALRLDPENRSATDSIGMALLKLGKLDEARDAYNKAVAEKIGANAYMGRAVVRSRLGDREGAQADAAEARRLRPDIDDTFAEYGLKL